MDFMGIKEGSLLYRKQIIFLSSHDRSTLMVQQRIINQLRAGIKNVWHSAESESSFKSRICLTDAPDTSLAPNTFQPSRDTFRNEPSTPSLYLSYKLFAQDLILTARMEALHIVCLLHLTSHVDYQKLNKIIVLPNINDYIFLNELNDTVYRSQAIRHLRYEVSEWMRDGAWTMRSIILAITGSGAIV